MKISEQFILRKIAQEWLLIPVGEAAIRVPGLIALSESGGMLYEMLQSGAAREDLIRALTEQYDVSAADAARDTDEFLEQMRQLKILEEVT